MSKSILILALVSLIVVAVGLTATASAGCSSCGAEENWDPSAKLNEIGNTAAVEAPPQIYNPAAARVTNSQFDRNAAQNNNASNSSTTNSAVQTPTLNVDLTNIGASPNPANPGSLVKITAVLGDVENMTAYAIIKNSLGVEVGNVTLDQSPGGEYIGTWNARIATGIYNATVVASAQGTSRTFNDVLQIEVKESSNATSNSNSNGKIATYTKLG